MSACAITVDGVLRKVVGYAPIPLGIQLYNALATQFQVVLLSDERGDEKGGIKYWLDIEGLHEHSNVVFSTIIMDDLHPSNRRLYQLDSSGYDVELVVEPDPSISAYVMENGYNTLTFSHAAYSLPSWRPDYQETVAPWADLEQQVAHNAMLRAQDRRHEVSDTS